MSMSDYGSAKKTRWLVTVIHNAALRSKRKYRRWQRDVLILNQPTNLDNGEVVDSFECPVAEIEFRNKEFDQLFTRLPEIQRRVMFDLYIRDFTQRQVAQDVSVSQQQVGRLRDRALTALCEEVTAR